MSLHIQHSENHEVYFCTVTCYQWLPLIEESQTYYSVYRWFEHLKNEGCKVVGYVIMPNHFLVLLYPTHSGTSLNKLVGEGKRFMAYDIVKNLERAEKLDLLKVLQEGVDTKEKLRGKKHEVFHLSFDARKCFNEKMIEQKLDYIHHNPLRGNGYWWMTLPSILIQVLAFTNWVRLVMLRLFTTRICEKRSSRLRTIRVLFE